MYDDHSPCMYYDRSTCMYHSRSSFLQGVWGAQPPSIAGGAGGAAPRICRDVDFGEIIIRVSCWVEIELICGQRILFFLSHQL